MTRFAGVALATLVAAAAPALAQDSQYWNIQYGPVGQLLGGQVVGSTRDLSATYYNPGGLALGEKTDFLLSVQAFSMRTTSTKPLAGGPFLDTSQTDFDAFPGFVAFSFPRGWLGDRTQLAFSVLTRQQFNQRLDERFAGTEPSRQRPLRPRDPLRPAHERDLGRADAESPALEPPGPRGHPLRGLPRAADAPGAEPPGRLP